MIEETKIWAEKMNEKIEVLTARRAVVEELTYRLMEMASKINNSIGEDMSYLELTLGFNSAQKLLINEMEKREQEYRSNEKTKKDS